MAVTIFDYLKAHLYRVLIFYIIFPLLFGVLCPVLFMYASSQAPGLKDGLMFYLLFGFIFLVSITGFVIMTVLLFLHRSRVNRSVEGPTKADLGPTIQRKLILDMTRLEAMKLIVHIFEEQPQYQIRSVEE
jgi:hypothetical protein